MSTRFDNEPSRGFWQRSKDTWNLASTTAKLLSTIVILLVALMFMLGLFLVRQDQNTKHPWEPLSQPDPPRISCLNVVVPGTCLPVETVMTYPVVGEPGIPAQYPTLHVPIGGPWPSFTMKSSRNTTEPISTVYDAWTQLVIPVDGAYDHSHGNFDLPKGVSNYAPFRTIGAEQQAEILALYAQGINTSVWQVQAEQSPVGGPSGTYPVGVHIGSENYAIVYGG